MPPSLDYSDMSDDDTCGTFWQHRLIFTEYIESLADQFGYDDLDALNFVEPQLPSVSMRESCPPVRYFKLAQS